MYLVSSPSKSLGARHLSPFPFASFVTAGGSFVGSVPSGIRSIDNSGSSVGKTRLLGFSGLGVFLLLNMCSESELSGVVDLQQLDSSVINFFRIEKLEWSFYNSDDILYSVIEFFDKDYCFLDSFVILFDETYNFFC